MKRYIYCFFSIVCFCNSFAYDLYVDGVYYNLEIGDNMTLEVTYGDQEYTGNIIIPENVEYNGKLLKVTKIGPSAFARSSVTTITIPKSVISIESGAFSSCTMLSSVSLTEGLGSIYQNAFKNCGDLNEITIPSSVTHIYKDAFNNSGLKRLILVDGDKDLSLGNPTSGGHGSSPFQRVGIEYLYLGRNIDYFNGNMGPFDYSNINEAVIGDKVKKIPNYCFQGLYITKLTIPSSVEIIGNASLNCSTLQEVIIKDSEQALFTYCSMPFLKKLYIGRNLIYDSQYSFISIGGEQLEDLILGESFTNFNKIVFIADLKTVFSLNENPPTILYASRVFSSKTYLYGKLYVPEGCLNIYQEADGWKNFFNIFETSGIDYIKNDKRNTNVRYNLMGQPIGNDYKGIIIEDGVKKIIR
ncbi:MAG: leucine-rich repeat protein [Bacteroidales bacterium]|nr:leucine-rich repeat protein [Bacteroidales bacterium]